MKSNFRGFNPTSCLGEKIPDCLYFREYDLEDDKENQDNKTKGKTAHISSEFCRLDKIMKNCVLGEKTNLKNGIISKKHLTILKEQKEKALRLLW